MGGGLPDLMGWAKERMFSLRYISRHHYGAMPLVVLCLADGLFVAATIAYMLITRDIQPFKTQAPFNMRISLLEPTANKAVYPWVTTLFPNQELYDIYDKMKEEAKERQRKLLEMARQGVEMPEELSEEELCHQQCSELSENE